MHAQITFGSSYFLNKTAYLYIKPRKHPALQDVFVGHDIKALITVELNSLEEQHPVCWAAQNIIAYK